MKAALLYGAETWRTNKTTLQKLKFFSNKCTRRIISVYWPEIIINTDLWERTQQQPIDVETRRRKWRWIEHTLRKPRQCIRGRSLVWSPQGRRARGRPRTTRRRETEAEMASEEKTWKELEKITQY
ncbi:hypothetical protein ElyMa_004547300 [Elysia marginata]|uniref:Endonuclease-reverse transcriptase n=1 Tax=Elysia marginata TaxID=1093978 RepID=A0AAV4HRY3_9GAST|nr:hypothetical protein ElyMa_004547300 [Elysia marginata]